MFTEFKRNTFFSGLDFVENVNAVEIVQDWSHCRSPSRAKRRHARGIRTRMVETRKPCCYRLGDVMVAHPEFIQAMRKKLADNHAKTMERHMLSVVNGGAT